MKSFLPPLVLVAVSLIGVASIDAQAASGTLLVQGAVADTTCSIQGAELGSQANIVVNLPAVPTGSLATAGAIAGTSKMGDIQMVISGCTGLATKAVAHFENGTTVDQTTGYLKNAFMGDGARNVEVRLLNAKLEPINIIDGDNNDIDKDGMTISGGSAILNYFAQYFATGKAEAGPVATSVQYTMQYQ